VVNRNIKATGRRHIDRLLLLLLLPGLLSGLWLAAGRHKTEARNRAVEFTLDYNELQNLSFSTGVPMSDLLSGFKAAGVTGVAVNEETLGDLVSAGEAKYERLRIGSQPVVSIVISDPGLESRVREVFASYNDPKLSSYREMPISASASPQTLNTIGIGLSPEAVQSVQNADLDVVARLANSPAMTTKAIDASIERLKKQQITRLIFSGEEVLGYKGLIKYTAEKIAANDMLYGSIEFGKQKGDTTMSEALKSNFVRVHSIASAEMATMTPAGMSERFARAVKERSIRLCYLRLPELVGSDPVEQGVSFIKRVRADVAASGYKVGEAHTFGNTPRNRPFKLLIALTIVAAALLLLESMITVSSGMKYGFLAVGFILAAGLSMFEKGLQGLALLAALVFPTLAVVGIIGPYFNADQNQKSPIGKTIKLFLATSAVSLCGALCVVGLLYDKSYMVKVNQFMGIKAAHGLPLLAIILMMAAGLPIFDKPISVVRRDVSENIRKVVNNPLFVWHVLAVVAALVIVGFALMRTGNDPGMGVSGFEMKFRSILDKVMMVRPRTKEFLIGHPALILGIAFLLTRRKVLGLPLVALGMLGQVSLVNTFCHIHTPLMMSVMRIVNGLVLGVIFGWILWRFVGRSGSSEKA